MLEFEFRFTYCAHLRQLIESFMEANLDFLEKKKRKFNKAYKK